MDLGTVPRSKTQLSNLWRIPNSISKSFDCLNHSNNAPQLKHAFQIVVPLLWNKAYPGFFWSVVNRQPDLKIRCKLWGIIGIILMSTFSSKPNLIERAKKNFDDWVGNRHKREGCVKQVSEFFWALGFQQNVFSEGGYSCVVVYDTILYGELKLMVWSIASDVKISLSTFLIDCLL